ncbi:MAG: molybdopterin-binding oxidoreductase [Caulobacterales bacterium]
MKPVPLAAVLTFGLAIAGGASGQDLSVTGLSGQTLTPTASQLAAMPHDQVTLHLEGGRTQACEGVLLSRLLQGVGAPAGKALRGPELADLVVVSANDGYRVVLALAETDSMFRTEKIVLADRCDGAALPANEGPYRLVIEGDMRPARQARMVKSIALQRAAP